MKVYSEAEAISMAVTAVNNVWKEIRSPEGCNGVVEGKVSMVQVASAVTKVQDDLFDRLEHPLQTVEPKQVTVTRAGLGLMRERLKEILETRS